MTSAVARSAAATSAVAASAAMSVASRAISSSIQARRAEGLSMVAGGSWFSVTLMAVWRRPVAGGRREAMLDYGDPDADRSRARGSAIRVASIPGLGQPPLRADAAGSFLRPLHRRLRDGHCPGRGPPRAVGEG